jgi:tetratricopeptide (TPR) repeat protein
MAAPLSPDAVALLQRAYARVQAGDGAGGTALLGQLPLAARGHPDALMVGAFAQKAQGALPKARALFEAATRAAPGQATIWNSYANLLDALGEHDLAITAYTRALAIDPRSRSSAGTRPMPRSTRRWRCCRTMCGRWARAGWSRPGRGGWMRRSRPIPRH